MEYKRLGSSDLDFSVLGLGYGWRVIEDAEVVPPYIRERRFAITRKALELGINWFDSSAVYALGHLEELLGAVIRELPIENVNDDVYIATKAESHQMRYDDLLIN